MTILRSEDVLNATIGYRSILVPNGGVFVLKQLLSSWIRWDTTDPSELDELDAILSETIALKEAPTAVSELLSLSSPSLSSISITAATPIPINTHRMGDTDVISYGANGLLTVLQTGMYEFDANIRFIPQSPNQSVTIYPVGALSAFTPRSWLYVETAGQINTVKLTAKQRLTAGQTLQIYASATNIVINGTTSGLYVSVTPD